LKKTQSANKKRYTCFATANALGKFSWGNLPFPQAPLDAIFFERMPQQLSSVLTPSVSILSKKTAKILTLP